MNRRHFIQSSATAAIGCGLLHSIPLHGAPASNRDRFGGWTGKTFEPTGFFRTEKDDRWWLVSPEGNAFLSWGINHLHAELWNQDYNSENWKQRLGIEELRGPEYFRALRSWFLQLREDYGFNTLGVHTSLNVVNSPLPAVPYMQSIRFVNIPHWTAEIPDSNFVDVFAPDFATHCDRLAREIALPQKDEPFLLGYAMTDCPLLTEEDLRERTDVIGGARRPSRIGWPRRLRNLPGDAPGKQAYVRTAQDLYQGRIQSFNSTYKTTFDSFDALASAENWRPETQLSNANETRDNTEFLHRTVAKYYQTTRDAIRRYDPNHLFVGDKINANTDSLDTVLPVTSQYTDIVFYQMYARYETQKPGLDRWSRMVDQPFINGDSAFTMITEHMPRPFGPVADNLEERAEWTEEFFRKAFARPEFVGWHYCGLIDAPNLIPRKQGRQHSGLLTGYGEPYPLLEKTIKACSTALYEIGRGV